MLRRASALCASPASGARRNRTEADEIGSDSTDQLGRAAYYAGLQRGLGLSSIRRAGVSQYIPFPCGHTHGLMAPEEAAQLGSSSTIHLVSTTGGNQVKCCRFLPRIASPGKTRPCMLRKALPCSCRVPRIGLLTERFSSHVFTLPTRPPANLQNGVTHRHLRDSRSRHRQTMTDLCVTTSGVTLICSRSASLPTQTTGSSGNGTTSNIRSIAAQCVPGNLPELSHTTISAGEESSACRVLLLKEMPKDDRWHSDMRQGAQNQLSSERTVHATGLTCGHGLRGTECPGDMSEKPAMAFLDDCCSQGDNSESLGRLTRSQAEVFLSECFPKSTSALSIRIGIEVEALQQPSHGPSDTPVPEHHDHSNFIDLTCGPH